MNAVNPSPFFSIKNSFGMEELDCKAGGKITLAHIPHHKNSPLGGRKQKSENLWTPIKCLVYVCVQYILHKYVNIFTNEKIAAVNSEKSKIH